MKTVNKTLKFLFILSWILLPTSLLAHGEEHNDTTEQVSPAESDTSEYVTESHSDANSVAADENDAVFKSLSEFPNLHPLVVHFPIVLLLLAFISQLASFFVFQKPLSWVTILLLLGGIIGAVFASNVFHPHTTGLTENMQKMLETHELYASLTTWLAVIALFLKIISHNWLNRKRWVEIVVLIFLAGSAITVSLAGHLGAQMVHVEGIGPQGNYIEQHDE